MNFLKPTSTAAGRKTRLDIQNYGCNGSLLCYHGVVERNRISSLQSHGKALEKECCLPSIFCDSGDTPANLLCELNGHLMPYTSCFYGKWVEDVCAGLFGVFVYLVLRWYGHVLRKDDDDWVKKCMEYEVEGSRPRGRPKRTWKEVVREDCQARKLNKEDAMDRCKWRKVIKEVR